MTLFKGRGQAGGFVPVNFCSLILIKVYNTIANKQRASPKQIKKIMLSPIMKEGRKCPKM